MSCHELIKVDTVSDLGVRFDSKLCFSDHANKKISKAYRVLYIGVIKRNFSWGLSAGYQPRPQVVDRGTTARYGGQLRYI